MKVVTHVKDEGIFKLLRFLNKAIISDLCLEKMKLIATFSLLKQQSILA